MIRLQDALKHLLDFDDYCYFMGTIDDFVDDFLRNSFLKDPLEGLIEGDSQLGETQASHDEKRPSKEKK